MPKSNSKKTNLASPYFAKVPSVCISKYFPASKRSNNVRNSHMNEDNDHKARRREREDGCVRNGRDVDRSKVQRRVKFKKDDDKPAGTIGCDDVQSTPGCIGSCSPLPMLWKFFDKYFSPESAVGANVRELSKFLRPMGLNNKRAERIIKFSQSYLANPLFTSPRELFGVGKYADDSWRLFCGETDDAWKEGSGFMPDDKMLRAYIFWRREYEKRRNKEQ
ncbi:3419_t:CDS:2 [Paraglomus brasilianum]|uniref:3419_t:CDS:1 n=1 Tax=Paraglomus brasilianum TaxID=144538 RepID=A0A9N9AXV9_9GLOM|nr:3419_t:CDS:2 [Paraglomus brasilianum]